MDWATVASSNRSLARDNQEEDWRKKTHKTTESSPLTCAQTKLTLDEDEGDGDGDGDG